VHEEHLADTLAADLAGISEETQNVVLGYLYQASPELGARVVRQLSAYGKEASS